MTQSNTTKPKPNPATTKPSSTGAGPKTSGAAKPAQKAKEDKPMTPFEGFLVMLIIVVIGIGVFFLGKAIVSAASNLFLSEIETCARADKIWYRGACLNEAETIKAINEHVKEITDLTASNSSEKTEDQKPDGQQSEDQKPTEQPTDKPTDPAKDQSTSSDNSSSSSSSNSNSSSSATNPSTAPTGPTAAGIKDRIITRCTYEYGRTLGANAKAECEDEYRYLTSSEAAKVYQLIQSGTSYSDALRQI